MSDGGVVYTVWMTDYDTYQMFGVFGDRDLAMECLLNRKGMSDADAEKMADRRPFYDHVHYETFSIMAHFLDSEADGRCVYRAKGEEAEDADH